MRELIKRCAPESVKNLYRKLRSEIVNPYRDARALRDTMKLAVQKRESRTSVSDNGYYPLVCYLASKYDAVFEKFKRNRIYRQILEHLSEQQGSEYLKVIDEYGILTSKDWQNFAKNDLYGGPIQFTYNIHGQKLALSSTTIRYAKVLCDILSMYDTGSIKSVAEIGIGYGGQCRLIRTKLPEAMYTLFDLPEVIGLAEKYLSNYQECRENIRYADGGHIYFHDDYDLVISNYAFTELQRPVQDMYLEKVILKSKRGYITYNPLSHDDIGGYSDDELLAKIPGSVKIDERPLTYKGNCIIVWGHKN